MSENNLPDSNPDLIRCIEKARFYRSKSEPITAIRPAFRASADPFEFVIAEVEHRDPENDSLSTDLYQLLLDAPTAPLSSHGLENNLEGADHLGTTNGAEYAGQLLAEGKPLGCGELHVISKPVMPANAAAKVSGAEQSNTSVVYSNDDDAVMVKFFRKLEPGVNPDVELLTGLSKAGCAYVPKLRAYSTTTIDDETYVTAMVQDFAAAKEGWDEATTAAKNGTSYAHEAGLLGAAVKAVHRDLAKAFGSQEVPATEVLRDPIGRLPELIEQAPMLAEYEARVRDAYARASASKATLHRIHGDLHLGQVLRTDDRFLLIDFEGEPARPLHERLAPSSPLRDLGGIIRSFGYAAYFPSFSGEGRGPADPEAWAGEATSAFLQGYGVEASPLLDAFVLDKALYEVAYEINNRPDWVDIPLSAVKRLLD